MSARLSSILVVGFLLFARKSVAQATLTVAAAADLSPLQTSLEAGYRKAKPDRPLRFVIASSSVLAQQIENGAPFDVFLSANAAYVDRLASNGRINPGSVRRYAVGRVAIAWKDRKPHALKDLAEGWVRMIAIPKPELAPYGAAAREALEHEHLWQAVSGKVVYGENVRQTLQMFDTGNADAVLTSDSFLHDRRDAQVLPDSWHRPIIQEGGVIAGSANATAAAEFLDFLLGPGGQAVFRQYGFSAPR